MTIETDGEKRIFAYSSRGLESVRVGKVCLQAVRSGSSEIVSSTTESRG